ncbi:MAG: DUF2752 domain-containing protein [Planctomycetota bacterium]
MKLCLLALSLLGGSILLFVRDPSEAGFYPSCFFLTVTGFQCPGCGTLRGMHALLHGDLLGALRCNPMLVLTVPLGGYTAVSFALQELRGRPLPVPMLRSGWILGVLGGLIGYWVVRNTGLYPF